MKRFPIYGPLIALLLLPACDKAKLLTELIKKKQPAAAASTASAPGPVVIEISEKDFETFSKQSGRVVVMDFNASWCGPCQQLGPILDKIAEEHHGSVLIGKVNVDQNHSLAASKGVQNIPDVRIFRDGKQVDQFIGLPPEGEVRKRIETHLVGLPAPETLEPAAKAPVMTPADKNWLPKGMQRR